MIELRCDAKMHGRMDGLTIEVVCKSVFCGNAPGVLVLHTFDLKTGELISTRSFKNPGKVDK